MRLNATAEDDGWWNCTLSLAPTSNEFQLSCNCFEDWSITVVPVVGVEIEPCPSTTTPPVGPAIAGDSAPRLSDAANVKVVRMCMVDPCSESHTEAEVVLRVAMIAGFAICQWSREIQPREHAAGQAELHGHA